MNVVEKFVSWFNREKEPSEMEQVALSYQEKLLSLEGAEDDDLVYKKEIMNNIDHALDIDDRMKERKKIFHFKMPEIDGRVGAALISALAAIWVANISYDWGVKCMEYDQEGHVPPSRIISNGPKMPNPKV